MDINNRQYENPQGQQEWKPRRAPEPLFGFFGYIVGILSLIFVGSRLQYKYGMAGLAMTEIIILAVAVLSTNVFRFDLPETFPLRKPTSRQVGGTLVVWMGFWGLTMSLTMSLFSFFPDSLVGTNTSMNDFVTSVPFPLRVLIMAVMPAICEEALFRGFLQRSMRGWSRWPRIITVGILFGIMHLDPIRIPPTALLGVALALVMVKTENLLLPALFHFVHNLLSTLSTLAYGSFFLTASAPDIMAEAEALLNNPNAMLAMACVYGMGAPFLILAGNILLEPRRPHVAGRFAAIKPQFIAAGIATGVFALGLVISIVMAI